jgi:hypothetical protein
MLTGMLVFQVLLKEPLKLTLKAVNKKPAPVEPRPPLKLTLPKPATYPYSTNAFAARISDSTDMSSAVLSENKLIRRAIDNHVKLKEEEDDMKLPVFGEQTADFLKSGTVMRFKLGLVQERLIASGGILYVLSCVCLLKVEEVMSLRVKLVCEMLVFRDVKQQKNVYRLPTLIAELGNFEV